MEPHDGIKAMRPDSMFRLCRMAARNMGFLAPSCILGCMLSCILLALTSCASDSISDRREGQLILCHKGKKTLAVSNADSFLHLDHGDTLGTCPEQK
jgi:hypothetical protein